MNLAAKTTKKSQNSALCGGFFLEIIEQNHHCPQNPRNSMFSRRQWWFSKVLTEQKPPLGIKPSPWTYDCALCRSTYRFPHSNPLVPLGCASTSLHASQVPQHERTASSYNRSSLGTCDYALCRSTYRFPLTRMSCY